MSDYISRDSITEWRPKNIEIFNSRAYIDLEELLALVDGIPAADVEPVRRVRLAESEEQYVEEFGWFRWVRCLNCSSGFYITGHPRYCPYCGGNVVLEGKMTEAEAMAEIQAKRAEQEAASEMEDSINFDDFFASFDGTDQVDSNQTDPESDHTEAEETTTQDYDSPEEEQNETD